MATTHRSELIEKLEVALTDEAYDGGFGPQSEEQFSAHVRRLAETAAEVVDEVCITIRHEGGNTLTGTVEQVLSTHLAKGWVLDNARRAPLQATRGVGVAGTISWEEHLEVWAAYAAVHGDRQSAERIADRGGFGHSEVRFLLGREPRTFRAGGAR